MNPHRRPPTPSFPKFDPFKPITIIDLQAYNWYVTRRPITTPMEQPSRFVPYSGHGPNPFGQLGAGQNRLPPPPIPSTSWAQAVIATYGFIPAVIPYLSENGLPTYSWTCSCYQCMASAQQFMHTLNSSDRYHATGVQGRGPLYEGVRQMVHPQACHYSHYSQMFPQQDGAAGGYSMASVGLGMNANAGILAGPMGQGRWSDGGSRSYDGPVPIPRPGTPVMGESTNVYRGSISSNGFEIRSPAVDAFAPSAPPLADLLEEPRIPTTSHNIVQDNWTPFTGYEWRVHPANYVPGQILRPWSNATPNQIGFVPIQNMPREERYDSCDENNNALF